MVSGAKENRLGAKNNIIYAFGRGKMIPYQFIRQALINNRLVHAYLVVGGSEEDRFAAAKYLAGVLICRENQGLEPCGSCRPCLQLGSGSYPDFIFIEPHGGKIKIDQVRQLEKRIKFKSFQGGAMIAVLAGADIMTEAAANCLLKTLEEPPGETFFVLLSTSSEGILPTIRSRCQELRLNTADLTEPGDDGENYWSVVTAAPDLRTMIFQVLPKLEKEKDIAKSLQNMGRYCRDQLVCKMTNDSTYLLAPEHGCYPRDLTPQQLYHCFQHIQDTIRALEINANRRLSLEVLFFNLFQEFNQGVE